MDERPGGDARLRRGVRRDAGGPEERGAQGRARSHEVGVGGIVEVGAEHDLEVGTLLDREPDVGHANLGEARGGIVGGPQRAGKASVPLGRNRGQQTPLVPEVVGRGGVGDPRPAGKIPEAQRRGA